VYILFGAMYTVCGAVYTVFGAMYIVCGAVYTVFEIGRASCRERVYTVV
jgi:hypothetical protein